MGKKRGTFMPYWGHEPFTLYRALILATANREIVPVNSSHCPEGAQSRAVESGGRVGGACSQKFQHPKRALFSKLKV